MQLNINKDKTPDLLSGVFMLSLASALPGFMDKSLADEFKTIAEIERSLNPLENIANHDGIKRSIDLQIQFGLGSATIQKSSLTQI